MAQSLQELDESRREPVRILLTKFCISGFYYYEKIDFYCFRPPHLQLPATDSKPKTLASTVVFRGLNLM